VQEGRTAEGAGQKIQRLKRRGDERAADHGARYDVGDEQAKEKIGDVRDGLGDADAAGQAEQAGPPQDKPASQKPPKIADDFTSRLLAARKRARGEMDDKEERE
jgi:hypothetical protein